MELTLTVFAAVLLVAHVTGEPGQCERVASETARADRGTIVLKSPDRLLGTWVSESCETRPGPEYLLRVYTFSSEGQYRAVQHRYWDESCTAPKYTVISRGNVRLAGSSHVSLGATHTELRPTSLHVTPHDQKAARELDGVMQSECPGHHRKVWRVYEERNVFDAHEHQQGHKPTNYRPDTQRRQAANGATHRGVHPFVDGAGADLACLGALRWAFNELRLTKVQLRPEFRTPYTDGRKMHLELMLGDVHSRDEMRENYSPTGLQSPLIRHTESGIFTLGKKHYNLTYCQLCSMVLGRSPPHLMKKPHLPPMILGEWTSVRCEVRPLGLYLTRRFRFYSGDYTWIGEHKFYNDPACSSPKFIATAAGHFKISSDLPTVKGSTHVDFQIERASLTMFDPGMLREVENKNCGSGLWQLGVPHELSSTNGCLPLGIIIPSIQYEIVKIDMDYHGSTLLYMGQADTYNQPRTKFQRPTAYQDALVHCSDLPLFSEGLREILNTPVYSGHDFYTTFDYLKSGAGKMAVTLWFVALSGLIIFL